MSGLRRGSVDSSVWCLLGSLPQREGPGGPPFLDDIIALHVLALFSRYSFLVPDRLKNPGEVWDAFCTSRIAEFGKPHSIQMDEGGEWKNELRVDLCADRYTKLQFQGAGAHPWISERRNGLARGIYNRPKADGRYAGRQLLTEVQFCLTAMLSTNGFSAYQMVFGSNPADNFGWGDGDGNLPFAQGTSQSGHFVAQWKLRMMAQETALREIANSKLRRISARNNSPDSVDVRAVGEVLFHKALSRRSSPRWRGPAKVLPLDETGATLSSQGQPFEVARHGVRRKVRALAEPEASCDDVSDDLCRLTLPMDEMDPPSNPPLGSLDL